MERYVRFYNDPMFFKYKRYETKRGQQAHYYKPTHEHLDLNLELIQKGNEFKGEIVSE
jgi:hypothetical protein